MQRHLLENNNVIYGELNGHTNFKYNFIGKNNILFISQNCKIKNSNINFCGDNALVFLGDGVNILNISLNSQCVFYTGNNNYYNPSGQRTLMLSERKNIIIGNDNLFSSAIWFRNADPHLIYDAKTNKRINQTKSIYIADHVWVGQEVAFLKGCFVASGAIIGTRSVATKMYYSNTINAGSPAKQIKSDIFWLGNCVHNWDENMTEKFNHVLKDDFKYSYDKSEFLSPKAIEERLEALNSPYEKLEFVYDALYCNKNKNRFAYFKDCPYDLELPKFKSMFKDLKFQDTAFKTTPPPPTLQDEINRLKKETDEIRQELLKTKTELKNKNNELNTLNFTLNNGTAKLRIYNQLNYKIGKAIAQNKKSPLGYIKLPFILSYIHNEHKKDQLTYQDKIKKNPKLALPKLQDYPDYKEALKIKDSLEYKLGEEFIKASKNWYKGGFVKFMFSAKKLK
ncbi:hypothetical protein [Campylobacter gastrosuis]|uniref:Acetyltransferase n=1 Tax=Campylobacter gastrosuis TaxID=2974576 RepID=A0ABT7HSK8_9BACT|nr:hypothetical protein [Campylobacter gastrosuis]MDL0089675.1 hypothetical protein [Campylobacter gastrosuis]